MSTAILHKDYDTRGGGEVFCRRLAETLDAPLYVGRRNQDNEPDADIDIREIPLSWLDKKAIDRGGITRTAAYALQWQAAGPEVSEFDTVITSGNEPLWYVPPTDQTVLAYTHSTPRFMYDLYNRSHDFTGIMGRVSSLFNTAMRTVYESNVNRPDLWVANSDTVARRINRYWNIPEGQITVVYPPVDVSNYSPEQVATEDYYLYLGRLAGHKRVDQVVRAFEHVDHELTIAGDGDERERLEKIAPENVTFCGFVDEVEKRRLYAEAKALVFPPQNEDFGMVPIESMAAGTPVIGVNEGFTKHQIIHGSNGLVWDRSVGNLYDAIRDFERNGVAWTSAEIAEFAKLNFGIDRFQEEMHEAIQQAQAKAEVQPEWNRPIPETKPVADGGE